VQAASAKAASVEAAKNGAKRVMRTEREGERESGEGCVMGIEVLKLAKP
jgi:hypothetical protein